MATTSYGWVSLSAETIANTVTQGAQASVALASNAAGCTTPTWRRPT